MIKTATPFLCLALLAGTAFAQSNVTTELQPVIAPDLDTTKLSNIVPSSRVALNYGQGGESLVNVTLSLDYPAVLLEEIKEVLGVVCTDSSVAVTFNSTAAFALGVAEWTLKDDFVIFTNHMGNCDVEYERGIFLADSLSWNNETLTITANAQKKDVASIASATEITFSNIPVPQPGKRAISITEKGVNVNGNVSLPADTMLVSVPPYVTVTADEAYIGADITFSGHLKYKILSAKLEEMYFDIDTALTADLGLTVDVTAPYNQTVEYAPDALSYALVNIPGILKFGPALIFNVGVELGAEAAVTVAADMAVTVPHGNVHIDFVHSNATTVSGWTPTYGVTVNITEKAAVHVNPFIGLTVELALELLGGLLDLSGGVTAEPKFTNEFTLAAGQTVGTGGSGQVDDGNSTTCDNGLNLRSAFDFSVTAFVTQFWETTLYSVEVPIADECYSWL